MEFYRLLGLEEVRRMDSGGGAIHLLVFMAPPGQPECPVELTYNWDGDAGLPSDSRHFGHLAYRVANVYETCQKLMDAGVTINRPPRDGIWPLCAAPTMSRSRSRRRAHLPSQEPWASMPNTGHW